MKICDGCKADLAGKCYFSIVYDRLFERYAFCSIDCLKKWARKPEPTKGGLR